MTFSPEQHAAARLCVCKIICDLGNCLDALDHAAEIRRLPADAQTDASVIGHDVAEAAASAGAASEEATALANDLARLVFERAQEGTAS